MYSAKFNFGFGDGAFFSITFTFFSTTSSTFYSSSSLDEHDEHEHEDEDPLECSSFKECDEASPYAVYASSFGVAASSADCSTDSSFIILKFYFLCLSTAFLRFSCIIWKKCGSINVLDGSIFFQCSLICLLSGSSTKFSVISTPDSKILNLTLLHILMHQR